jgi:peptidoglycan/xylan/chitin deacetylase (PgdA/CDA1 family)
MIVVTYHAIGPERSPIGCTANELRSDLRGLREAGYTFVTLDQCADWLAGGPDPGPLTAVITFDDGYASVAESAAPILEAERVPYAVFVIAGRIGQDNQWAGQWRSVPRLPLLDRGGLRDLARAGACIAAHTFTHPVLTRLAPAALEREIVGSAAAIEDLIGRPVHDFAYPYGAAGPRERDVARSRYRLAFVAAPAIVRQGGDPAGVPRADGHDLRVALRLRLCGRPALPAYLRTRRLLRALRGAARALRHAREPDGSARHRRGDPGAA